MPMTSREMTAGDVAGALADALVALRFDAIPAPVVHEAKRSLFNVLAVAIGASRHPGVSAILRVGRELGSGPEAPVVGRSERTSAHVAALANGFAGHVDDYDDTHLATVIHPAASIAAILLALGPSTAPSGADAMRAFVLGCEVQLRLGVAISPEHYDDGWHITGTCGAFGAAAAAAALLRLDAATTARALGLAALSTVGQREAFGTMAKPYHAGKAAANGLRAARAAARGTTAPPDTLARAAGALAHAHRIDTLDVAFGERWELAQNTYKPYPCGIVAHPAIDAAIELAPQLDATQIAHVAVHCNPLVPELMGNPSPVDGLQARFSAIHGVAIGLRDGRVNLAAYADDVVNAPDVLALRARVSLEPSPDMPRAAATVVVTLADERTFRAHVPHARGSRERPLTDRELAAKASALVEPILPGGTERLRVAISALTEAPSLDGLIAAVVA
jgi:2-methylcitrate dehydratase PrpD